MKKYLFYLMYGSCSSSRCFLVKVGKKSVFTPHFQRTCLRSSWLWLSTPVWERPAGRALHDVLDTDVPGLPQSERSFRIMYTSPKDYDAIAEVGAQHYYCRYTGHLYASLVQVCQGCICQLRR